MMKILFLLFGLLQLPWPLTATLYIHPDSSECSLHGSALKCDFNHGNDDVILDSLPEGGSRTPITVAYIYNVKKLTVLQASCADLSFYNVDAVDFPFNHACKKRPINLRFVDSTANQVPRQLSRLEVTRSRVDKVICDMGLLRAQLTNAEIGEFSSPWPVAGSYVIKIEHSTIGKLTDLNLESQMFLFVLNSTIGRMEEHSLILGRGASASLLNSDITCADDAIVVKGGAKFTAKEVTGKLSIMGSIPGKDTEYDRRPPGVPYQAMPSPPDDEDTKPAQATTQKPCNRSNPTWLWFVPTVLATLEAFIIIVLCGMKMPEPEKSFPKDDTETPVVNSSLHRQDIPFRDSSLHYYDESIKSYPTAFKRK